MPQPEKFPRALGFGAPYEYDAEDSPPDSADDNDNDDEDEEPPCL